MKKIFNLLFIAFVGLAFNACQNDESVYESATGTLKLNVGIDASTVIRDYNPTQIAVQVVDADGEVVQETDDYTEWSDGITLTPGEYTVNASSAGFDGDSGFDNAYYTGSTDVTITKGSETTASITCTLANVKVTVNYSDDFISTFTTVDVTVQDVDAEYTAVSFATDETRSAYFPVADLLVTYTLTNSSGETNSDTYTISGVQARDHYIINFTVEEDQVGYVNGVTVSIGSNNEYTYTFTITPTVITLSATLSDNSWATFSYLTASSVLVSPTDVEISALSFLYRVAGSEGDWISVEATINDDGDYEAIATDLSDNTEYEYKLAGTSSDGSSFEMETASSFTTEEATALYNGDFDAWYTYGNIPYAIFEEDATETDSNDGYLLSYWDSGNVGGNLLNTYPTQESTDEVHTSGGSSAYLQSQYIGLTLFGKQIYGKFAAGNIYTGHYVETYTGNPMGARIRFGVEFESRPTQLTGWFKYTRGTDIDNADDDTCKEALEETGGDLCGLYVALSDSPGFDDSLGGAYEINNEAEEDEPENLIYQYTIDWTKDNDYLIAYGSITSDEEQGTGEWQQFTIDLQYVNLTRKPKYLIVVASSSKYGDYFTGSSDSSMYLDDFELVYSELPTLWE